MKTRYERLLELYENGTITRGEVMINVYQTITSENVAEVLADLPKEIRDEVVITARLTPNPQAMRLLRMCSAILRTEEAREAYERGLAEEQQLYRDGLQAVKDYVVENDLY